MGLAFMTCSYWGTHHLGLGFEPGALGTISPVNPFAALQGLREGCYEDSPGIEEPPSSRMRCLQLDVM